MKPIHIINNHQQIIKNSTYVILDPEAKITCLNDKIKTQEEIIDYFTKSSLNNITIQYNDNILLKYTLGPELNYIRIEPIDPNSVHLLRLLGLKKNRNYLINNLHVKVDSFGLHNILNEINLLLDTLNPNKITDYCSVCGIELKTKGLDKINICTNPSCFIKSKTIVLDNRITDLYKKDPVVCELLIRILIEGSAHPKKEKIFKPLPIINNILYLDQFKVLLDEETKLNHLNISNIQNSNSDIELYKNIGPNAYGIINNAISDNFFSISTVKISSQELPRMGIPKLYTEETDVFESGAINIIGFNYSYEVENKFKKEHFLFHGSPLQCWYPIMKTGLKVMSGTEFMTTGAAYGNGVYFSNNFSMSYGYSRGYLTSKSDDISSIVGVFEIGEDILKYKKAEQIYVVDNDKIMLLRYLIVIKKTITNFQDISDYFVKYLGSINKLNDKKSINIKNKRFGAEMKLLNANKNVQNVKIIDELKNWTIELNDIKNKYVKLEIYFNDYPKLPPKIILDSNINKSILCDDTNNLLLPELNPAMWEVTNNLSKLVDKIHLCIFNSI